MSEISYTASQVDIALDKFFNSLNTVIVSTDLESAYNLKRVLITMSDGVTTLEPKKKDGKWIFYPNKFGEWTITGNLDGEVVTESINITNISIHDEIVLQFNGGS